MSEREFFGSVVVRKGYATSEEVMECLKVQRRARQLLNKKLPLGEIMVFQGILTSEQLREILEEMGVDEGEEGGRDSRWEDMILFGDMVLERGVVSSQQLLECIDEQWRRGGGGFLGDILKERGYLTEEQYREVLDLYEKSGTLTVVAFKDELRFRTDAVEEMQQEVEISSGVQFYSFPEKLRMGRYTITWYVRREGSFWGPFSAPFTLKGDTCIAPVVDGQGRGWVLYFGGERR
ncbi:MAG: hypothetical protein D6805_05015 [Planctomycetota bacterium]|nr:MAG: hypothetical protein D6805_05015 [Planctomycetota bacterium]